VPLTRVTLDPPLPPGWRLPVSACEEWLVTEPSGMQRACSGMITRVARFSVPLVIGVAAFVAVFGLVVWLVERRKGERYTGRLLLLGLPGLYLAGLPYFGGQNGCRFLAWP
jgi:hypothetical protein